MTQPDLRQQIRDLIAAKITDKLDEWGVGEPFPEDQLADAVMELFPDVEVERTTRTPGLVIPVANYTLAGWAQVATHTQFVLRTAPEQIAEEPA